MGNALASCLNSSRCLYHSLDCPDCAATGVCKNCKGAGLVTAVHDIEVFSYVLDKKGAYRDMKEPPKQCPKCGGWGGSSQFRGIITSVAPTSSLQVGQTKKKTGQWGEAAPGDGVCRRCKGSGRVSVQPEWMRETIAANSPAKYAVPGPIMTSPYKPGPLRVPGTKMD